MCVADRRLGDDPQPRRDHPRRARRQHAGELLPPATCAPPTLALVPPTLQRGPQRLHSGSSCFELQPRAVIAARSRGYSGTAGAGSGLSVTHIFFSWARSPRGRRPRTGRATTKMCQRAGHSHQPGRDAHPPPTRDGEPVTVSVAFTVSEPVTATPRAPRGGTPTPPAEPGRRLHPDPTWFATHDHARGRSLHLVTAGRITLAHACRGPPRRRSCCADRRRAPARSTLVLTPRQAPVLRKTAGGRQGHAQIPKTAEARTHTR